MLLKKKGLPEEGDIVICTITAVQHHSVFARIEDFGSSGMIHISEISPGRIRNIRDFVKEGKIVVCKVLRVNASLGHIDLSLRRVNEGQRRNKIAEQKLEQKAESFIEIAAKKLKKNPIEVVDLLASKLLVEYVSIFAAFMQVVEGNTTLKKLGVPEPVATELEIVIKDRLKPESVSIKGVVTLITYLPNGIEILKNALNSGVGSGIKISYLGAGKYSISVVASNYKIAENMLDESSKKIISSFGNSGIASFSRSNEGS